MMRDNPDNNNQIDGGGDHDTGARQDISETLPNPPEFTLEVEPGPVIHGLGGGFAMTAPFRSCQCQIGPPMTRPNRLSH